jgi:hypothetical protein
MPITSDVKDVERFFGEGSGADSAITAIPELV